MTIFAGAFVRRVGQAIPSQLIGELRASVSRYPDDADTRTEFADENIFIIKIDVGAFGELGESTGPQLLTFVAGDPILQPYPTAPRITRVESAERIGHDLAAGQNEALRSCRGTYCAAIYEHSSHKLYLITDKLGVRPVYCWVSPDYIVFATALRILEAVSFCNKSLDLQGIAEIACFGYPLSDRTPYKNIFSLHAGEVFSVDAGGLKRERYWRWDKLPEAPAYADKAQPERLYRIFMDAVEIRLRGQKVAAAFLSGGLDSRAVVAALRGAGVEVFTANFGSPASQDRVLGELAAKRLGTHYSHLELHPLLVEDDPRSHASIREWLRSPDYLLRNPLRPRVAWTGEGGSVGMGHIYLNSDMVASARSGDVWGGAQKLMSYNHWGLQAKLLKKEIARAFDHMVNEGIRAELQAIHLADPGRIYYLFLLLNDQRRHMFNHFENMDLTRTEFEMPFYDGEFIAGVMREPIDNFLRHVFYLEWLKLFPQGVLEIPWQAYPNHVPCPLPQPEGLTHQWQKESHMENDARRRIAALNGARNLLCVPAFSRKYMRGARMRLFMLAIQWGKADRSYLMHVPSVIYRYWSRASS